jgi:hypothetical protein
MAHRVTGPEVPIRVSASAAERVTPDLMRVW